MKFKANTQQELKDLNIQNGKIYTIKYLDRDYFNGEENLKTINTKAIVDNEVVSFIVKDDYGMDKFINKFRVII